MKYLLVCITAVIISGCTTTDAVRLNDSSAYSPSDYVAIFNEPPNRPYEELALLESRGAVGQSLPDLLESMRQSAKELGADAIIPTMERSEYQLPGFIYNSLIGGYISLPGGRVPILRGYAIIFEENRSTRSAAYRKAKITVGATANGLPFALSGYGASAWGGKGKIRVVAETYKLDTPQALLRDGFTNGRVESAKTITGDYFLMHNLSGVYFGMGLGYATNSVGFENSSARGEWDVLFLSGSFGYLHRFGSNFHLDSRLALYGNLSSEEKIDVGGHELFPDKGALGIFIGLGVNF